MIWLTCAVTFVYAISFWYLVAAQRDLKAKLNRIEHLLRNRRTMCPACQRDFTDAFPDDLDWVQAT